MIFDFSHNGTSSPLALNPRKKRTSEEGRGLERTVSHERSAEKKRERVPDPGVVTRPQTRNLSFQSLIVPV
jgi:hypothetical protein